MSESIQIAENKTLKLNNILYREIGSTDNKELNKTMKMIESYMKSNELKPYGPLIIMSETDISGTVNNTIMVQLRLEPKKTDPPYSFDESMRIERCLMARYMGPANTIQMASMKAQVYAFENNIELSGISYTIVTEQRQDGTILADIFLETAK